MKNFNMLNTTETTYMYFWHLRPLIFGIFVVTEKQVNPNNKS